MGLGSQWWHHQGYALVLGQLLPLDANCLWVPPSERKMGDGTLGPVPRQRQAWKGPPRSQSWGLWRVVLHGEGGPSPTLALLLWPPTLQDEGTASLLASWGVALQEMRPGGIRTALPTAAHTAPQPGTEM